jgi:hypothetical protein
MEHGAPQARDTWNYSALQMRYSDWNAARAQWRREHPEGLRDVQRGIYSSARPGLLQLLSKPC